MFGTNPVRKQEPVGNISTLLWVQEIFYTIQGEGPFAGDPAVFIRLAGCNLKCHFCDADFESSTLKLSVFDVWNIVKHLAHGGGVTRTEKSILINEVRPKKLKTDLVVLTGGEPLRQFVEPLIKALNTLGFRVQVETSGTLWYTRLEPLFTARTRAIECKNSIVCSPKTPKLNKSILPFISAFKYIVSPKDSDEVDGLPMTGTQIAGQKIRVARPWDDPDYNPQLQPVYVQACCEYTGEEKFINLTGSKIPVHYNEPVNRDNAKFAAHVAMKHGYKLSTQVHKLAGVP